MDMEIDALRWFQQVADGVTVTEVAEIYLVSQPAVSRGLARLEDEVGTSLLRRQGRILRMTPAGAAFKRHVDAMLNDLDDGLAAVEQLIDPETGSVSLAFQISLGTWLVPTLISSFRLSHPAVTFDLQRVRDDLPWAVLLDGRVDLEITTVDRRGPGIEWHRLTSEPLCLAVPPGHRLTGLDQVDLTEVAVEPFVTLRPASQLRRLGHDLCAAAGFEPRVAFEGDDLPTVMGFVQASLGVAIVPQGSAAHRGTHLAEVDLIPIDNPDAGRDIGLAWSAERRLLPAAELFRKHVITHTSARRVPTSRIPTRMR